MCGRGKIMVNKRILRENKSLFPEHQVGVRKMHIIPIFHVLHFSAIRAQDEFRRHHSLHSRWGHSQGSSERQGWAFSLRAQSRFPTTLHSDVSSQMFQMFHLILALRAPSCEWDTSPLPFPGFVRTWFSFVYCGVCLPSRGRFLAQQFIIGFFYL